MKEALLDERKLQIIHSELHPLLTELKTAPTCVIHKRLQDVSEMVAHLLKKWQRGAFFHACYLTWERLK